LRYENGFFLFCHCFSGTFLTILTLIVAFQELGGPRRFELAISVTVCPGLFARTKLITLCPRFQIVNLLHRELVVAQAGCLESETIIPSQSSVPLHWEKQSGSSKIHLGAPSSEERDNGKYERCWTNGCIQVDKIGITSMRLPTNNSLSSKPMVVQAEVRLATKDQSSAVVIVIWSANEKSNPLYILRNQTLHTILCRQPLQDEPSQLDDGNDVLAVEPFPGGCSSGKHRGGYECGSEVGPMIRSLLGIHRIEEFVWVVSSGGVSCFGFDDPEKPHILEWTCVANGSHKFDDRATKAFLEVDAMGSLTTLKFGKKEICCQINAEHSTKVIEFFEFSHPLYASLPTKVLRRQGVENYSMLKAGIVGDLIEDTGEAEDEEVAFSLRIETPAAIISVIDNADADCHGREILLVQLDKIMFSFSQNREGYHEFECLVASFQVDNLVNKSIHPVLVRQPWFAFDLLEQFCACYILSQLLFLCCQKIFCPKLDANEPFLHMSAVRRLQQESTTLVFRYAAIRVLEIHIFLDRRYVLLKLFFWSRIVQ